MTNCGAVANAAVLKKCAGRPSGLPADFGLPTIFGRCSANPANELLFVACVTVTGIPDCSEKMHSATTHPATHSPIPRRRKPMPSSRRQIVDPAERSHIRHIAVRGIPLQIRPKGIRRHQTARVRRRQHRRREYRRSIVNQLRMRVGKQKRNPRENLCSTFASNRVVVRRAAVVPVSRHIQKPRIRL